MPITRVPVVHKFGIISHSQRLELQERLLKQTYLQSVKSRRVHISQRNPLEVSEDFIQQFNNAETYDEKTKCEEIARKMLERAKRRAGVRNSGTGNHVNLPLAWTELAQIAQCKGTVQEECLDVLIASLDVSPLAKYHIPALFFLAETMLYWLRTDAVHQPYLRTGEIKLLRMGQLVFQRLFYHHMAGQLQGHSDFKNRLFTYTDGLAECQEAYNPYPNALLSMRFIIEVSKIILADTVVEPGEVKEGDNLPDAPRLNTDEMESVTKEMYERELRDVDTHSSHSGAISSSVHDLSPTLWHALDVWRCTNSLSGGLREALKALAHCGLGLASETWVDGVIALNILAETAKSNMAAMKVLHRLAQGVKTTEDLMTPPLSSRSGHSDMFSISSNDDEMMLKQSDSRGSYLSSKPSLSDIYERSDEGDPEKKVGSSASATGISSASNSYNLGNSQTSTQDSLESQKEDVDELYGNQDGDASKPKPVLKEPASGHKPLKSREVSFDETSIAVKERNLNHGDQGVLPKKNVHGGSKGSRQKQESHPSTKGSSAGDGVPGTGFQPEVGSDFFTSRGSDASSAPTFTNLPLPETPGINGWHWEVAFTYTDMLADICINGKTANIQKMALVGNNVNMMEPYRRIVTTVQLPSAGLLDLAVFHALNEADDGGPNDWSWRIRYGAIQSLVKVVRSLEGDKAREGLRSAAWNALLKAHSSEKDGRVLEALKVGQVHTDIQGILGKDSSTTSIGSRVAAGLSVIYLPPLPPPVDMSMPRPTHSRRHINVMKPPPAHTTRQRQPLRTSLKEELDLATSLYEPPVDFNTRTSFDLRRIVEDQWRKELQNQYHRPSIPRTVDTAQDYSRAWQARAHKINAKQDGAADTAVMSGSTKQHSNGSDSTATCRRVKVRDLSRHGGQQKVPLKVITMNLCQCLNAVDLSVAVERCLCSDQLSSTSWWRHAVLDNGPDVNMTSQLYETLVA
ncbi:hypothetical protein BaRGS_00005042, partial [Batillaria attramentaria]